LAAISICSLVAAKMAMAVITESEQVTYTVRMVDAGLLGRKSGRGFYECRSA
jgi:3-hydroxyacyl-CoA dehydrogenase